MVDAAHLEELAEATRRLVRTVDAMPEDAYAEPSPLPGWSRGHVVAHLALNAEGLAAALRGLTEGRSVPVYASQEARDADIGRLGAAEPEAVRSRLLGAVTDFVDAVTAVPADAWDRPVERTPDGARRFPARAVPLMRHREVEIHHADLGLGYAHRDWPDTFCVRLIDSAAERSYPRPFSVHATDLDRTWHLADGGGPTVSGTAADLGWWLTGRGEGAGLTCSDGSLPGLEGW